MKCPIAQIARQTQNAKTRNDETEGRGRTEPWCHRVRQRAPIVLSLSPCGRRVSTDLRSTWGRRATESGRTGRGSHDDDRWMRVAHQDAVAGPKDKPFRLGFQSIGQGAFARRKAEVRQLACRLKHSRSVRCCEARFKSAHRGHAGDKRSLVRTRDDGYGGSRAGTQDNEPTQHGCILPDAERRRIRP